MGKPRADSNQVQSRRERKPAAILLESGSVYEGWALGPQATVGAEFVFHTGHTGYQEILTDPSYRRQIIVFSSPQIGNQGFHEEDFESRQIWASGCVMRNYSPAPFHWRAQKTLEDCLIEQAVPGIFGVDTRRLVLELRDKGALRGVLSTESRDRSFLEAELNKTPSMNGLSLSGEVSRQKEEIWTETSHKLLQWGRPRRISSDLKRVAVLDLGVKQQILRYLVDVGFEEVRVFPSRTSAEEILASGADAVLISNGPGDPAAETYAIEQVKKLLGQKPLLGICLGHQILALALGMETYKLKFGHHAANHPVLNKARDFVEISSQNHGFAVKDRRQRHQDQVFHYWHLNDGSLAGFYSESLRCMGIQFHPEASPGPLDSTHIFENFKKGRVA